MTPLALLFAGLVAVPQPSARAQAPGQLAVFVAVNEALIANAQHAIRTTSHPDIREFACAVIHRHEELERLLDRLAPEHRAALSAEPLASEIVARNGEAFRSMTERHGMSRDRAYLRSHDALLTLIGEGIFEPRAAPAEPEVGAILREFRSRIRHTLESAVQLRADLIGWHS